VFGGKLIWAFDDTEAKKVKGAAADCHTGWRKPPYGFQALGVLLYRDNTWDGDGRQRKNTKVEWILRNMRRMQRSLG